MSKRKITSYSSGKNLGRAWALNEIEHEVKNHRAGSYIITADPRHIWNGNKQHLLAARTSHGIIAVVREDTLSLGPAAKDALIYACYDPVKTVWDVQDKSWKTTIRAARTGVYVLVDQLDESIFTKTREELLALFLASSRQILLRLLKSFDRGISDYRFKNQWNREVANLEQAGLTVPDDIAMKKRVLQAKHKLLEV